jgi:Asp/Glu/hydantoin racemase
MTDRKLGILMLDTQFPRIEGDAGNPETYSIDVLIQVVDGVSSLDVVNDKQISEDISQKFIDAAKSLEMSGVSAIISTCGFLFKEQEKIAAAVDVPVMVSSLSLYQDIKRKVGTGKIVILTASKSDLSALIQSSGNIVADEIEIIGMERCQAFSEAILQEKKNQSQKLKANEIETFLKSEITHLLSTDADIGAILIECGNLPPYIPAIKSVTDLPVYSILDGVDQMMSPIVDFQ